MVVVEPVPPVTANVLVVANHTPEPILTHTLAVPFDVGFTVKDRLAVPPGVVDPDALSVNVGVTGVTVIAFDVAPDTTTR